MEDISLAVAHISNRVKEAFQQFKEDTLQQINANKQQLRTDAVSDIESYRADELDEVRSILDIKV